MPAAFPVSVTEAWKVTKNEDWGIEYEQRQKYTIAGLRTTKVMRSLVHIELDKEDYITRMEDRWYVSVPAFRAAERIEADGGV